MEINVLNYIVGLSSQHGLDPGSGFRVGHPLKFWVLDFPLIAIKKPRGIIFQ